MTWAVFCCNQRPSQISPIAENGGAAIPPIFFIVQIKGEQSGKTVDWSFMLCILNVIYQVRLGEFLLAT